MKRFAALALVLVIAACGRAEPHVGGSVGPGGASAHAGVRSGPASVSVGPGGANASVRVAQRNGSSVRVGTGGVSASTRVGNSPLSIGIGMRGLRLFF